MVYIVNFVDYTISGSDCILGVYDNKEDAQKRANDFTKSYIRSDDRGPLGKAEVVAYVINEAVPGNAAESYDFSKEK